jgi:polyisoprenoid-binding protein YceI
MKKIHLFALVLIQMALFSCKSNTEEQKIPLNDAEEVKTAVSGERYTIDPEACDIIWEGKKLMKKHRGSIKAKQGFVLMDNGDLVGGQIMIDMNSIDDKSQTGSSKENLESHLKSDDFFDVANHPFASFTITKTASYVGDGGINTLIYGNLTIKGITKSTQLKANVELDSKSVNIQAPMFTFDRAEFDIRYDSASFFDNLGDKAIDDEIGLAISINAFL